MSERRNSLSTIITAENRKEILFEMFGDIGELEEGTTTVQYALTVWVLLTLYQFKNRGLQLRARHFGSSYSWPDVLWKQGCVLLLELARQREEHQNPILHDQMVFETDDGAHISQRDRNHHERKRR
jgi:hypothetical protein